MGFIWQMMGSCEQGKELLVSIFFMKLSNTVLLKIRRLRCMKIFIVGRKVQGKCNNRFSILSNFESSGRETRSASVLS
jgi:hypothetical protein